MPSERASTTTTPAMELGQRRSGIRTLCLLESPQPARRLTIRSPRIRVARAARPGPALSRRRRLQAALVAELELHPGNVSEVARAMGKARMPALDAAIPDRSRR